MWTEETNAELAGWLLSKGASARKQDLKGLTPLDRAALAVHPNDQSAQRCSSVANLLLEHGGQLTIRAAVALGDLSRIRELIEASPELLRQIESNGGLLTLAVNHGQVEVVRLLLDLGADVDERILLKEVEEPTPSWGMHRFSRRIPNLLADDAGSGPSRYRRGKHEKVEWRPLRFRSQRYFWHLSL